MELVKLVVHQSNGHPLLIDIPVEEQNETAHWLEEVMRSGAFAIFKDHLGTVQGVVRGGAILGFGFEPDRYDPKLADLHRRRLQAEVEHLELAVREMRNRNDGESWKDSY